MALIIPVQQGIKILDRNVVIRKLERKAENKQASATGSGTDD